VRRPREPDDGGQVLLLILVYALIVFLLVSVVVSATSVHLARTRLVNLADAAALDAADSLDEPSYYAGQGWLAAGPGGGSVPLSDASVGAAVSAYLTRAAVSPSLEGLAVGVPTGAPDATSAEVTLVARVRLPMGLYVLAPWSDGIALRATGRARATPPPG
jgi:hypothetical protein